MGFSVGLCFLCCGFVLCLVAFWSTAGLMKIKNFLRGAFGIFVLGLSANPGRIAKFLGYALKVLNSFLQCFHALGDVFLFWN